MHRLKEEQRRAIVVQYKFDHPEKSNYAVSQFFKEMNVATSTVYSILNTFKESGTVTRASGSGQRPLKMPPRKRNQLLKDAQAPTGASQRRLASKYGISQPYVQQILRANKLKAFKKEKAPKSTPQQVQMQVMRIGRLYRHFLSCSDGSPDIVMDDESYFPFSAPHLPQNSYYYATSKHAADPSVRYAPIAKFERKLMVWIAISSCGISQPYFCPAKAALNGDIYREGCITKRLIPFLRKHHSNGQYLFWPDLASCHYAGETLRLLDSFGVQYVRKEMNPPNCPQLRPIEDFWGLLKQKVYAKGWNAESIEQLQRRIHYCLSQIDMDVVRHMMETVKSNLRKARADGVVSLIH
jgi:transposase